MVKISLGMAMVIVNVKHVKGKVLSKVVVSFDSSYVSSNLIIFLFFTGEEQELLLRTSPIWRT